MKKSKICTGVLCLGLSFLLVGLTGCGTAEGDLNTGGDNSLETTDEATGEWVEPPLDDSDLGSEWDRLAPVYLPSDYTASKQWPLVFLLHGYSATGSLQDMYLRFSDRVDSHGFILVIPEGTMNPDNKQFWNATEACCDFYGQSPDDTGYLMHLMNEAKSRYNINAGKVYFTGHSNGGFMSHRMACEHADVVTGIMSLAGSTFKDPARCQNSEPVAMLQVHGTEDSTIPYAGNAWYPGAEELTAMWRERNACAETQEEEAIAIEGTLAGNETRVLTANSCTNNMTAELWTIDGGSHIPAFNSDFTDLVLDFLLFHEKAK